MSEPVLVLDVRDVWIARPFEALGARIRTVGVHPSCHPWRWLTSGPADGGAHAGPTFLPPRTFGRLAPWIAPLAERCLQRRCRRPQTVVLTYPHQRAFVNRFPGARLMYYVADDYSTMYGWPAEAVREWEAGIADRVDDVVVVSRALKDVYERRYPQLTGRVQVSANAAPRSMIPSHCPSRPIEAPPPIPRHFRPLAGVVGRLSSRLRWDWIRHAVESLPWLHWAFIGGEADSGSGSDFLALKEHPRCCFTGPQPYESLFPYAACLDVAIILYAESAINRTASPVRLYTHLPFGQPILASPGCRQLDEFEPLVTLCPGRDELVQKLEALRRCDFRDGGHQARWRAASGHTWERRADGIYRMLNRAPPLREGGRETET